MRVAPKLSSRPSATQPRGREKSVVAFRQVFPRRDDLRARVFGCSVGASDTPRPTPRQGRIPDTREMMIQRTVSLWRRLLGPADDPNSATAIAEDRRRSVRHAIDEMVHFRPASSEGPDLTAQLRDVSAGGISLLADQPFRPGDLLSIRLPGPTGDLPTTVLACVVHVGPGPGA